jgi:PAS domain S-box-containing protein
MSLQFSIYTVPLALAAGLSAALVAEVFRLRDRRTAPQVLGVLVATTIWAGADALRIASDDPAQKLLWQDVRFLGSTLVVLALFLHALEYSNREQYITTRSLVALSAVFVVTNGLVWTDQLVGHDLVITGYRTATVGSTTVVEFDYGPWFYLNAAYSYLLLAGAMGMYVTEFLRRRGAFRRQTAGLILALSVPWTLNGVFLLGYSPIDLTAFGLTVTAVAFVAQLHWFRLLDIVPIARSTVVNHIENGYFVIDADDMVLDVNEAGAELLGRPREAVIGTTVDDLFAAYPGVVETFRDRRDVREDITLHQDDERHDYEVDISPIHDDHDQYVGRVLLIRDVTERRRRQRELERRTEALERQNERLDRFANIVAHDLRNPLSVAKGHLELDRADHDPENLDEVEAALDRMDEITDDVLALARQEEATVDPEPVDLAECCLDAWRTVDTGEADLRVRTARTVAADPSQLRRSLENLFRNTIEQGGPAVDVAVGDLEDGFYVADDGPGIPPDERDRVFESGYTTIESGTGFGLSVVENIAEAHGWSVRATESEAGGARFEFIDVAERPPDDTYREAEPEGR